MRGIGCLLTGIELFPGNIQGGSDTPAGWASGISIDQEIKNFLQAKPETRTRFGSLEFGVMVPDRADTWTRMVYAGPNKPIAPIDDPYQMFAKLYGRMKDQREPAEHPRRPAGRPEEGRARRQRRGPATAGRARHVRPRDGAGAQGRRGAGRRATRCRELEPGVKEENDNIPRISKMQIDLMVNSFAADFARVATLQYTNSVGGARMRWLGVDEGHHELSHEPDSNEKAQEKLTKINKWYCEQLAYLAQRLAETPEPGGEGSLLDNTLIVWTNELGKGNSHTLDNIPFVLVGDGLDFKMGRASSTKACPTTGCCCRWPTASATASRSSATRTSAATGR